MTITVLLIIVIAGASILAWNKHEIMQKWIMNPYYTHKYKQYYRFITSGFIHADYMHLGFNLFVMYSFGNFLEYYFAILFGGSYYIYLLVLFLLAVIVSSIPTFLKHKDDIYYNSLGASGGVSAMLFATIMLEPLMPMRILFIPIDIPGIIIGIGYLLYENYQGKKGNDNINHDAHMYGALFGVLFIIATYPQSVPDFFNKILGALGL